MSQIIPFEKIVPEGKAMGHLPDGRALFCIGPLPDETARVGIRKHKRTYAEAVLHEIVEPSPKRNQPAEDHCLICSPWQGVEYEYQCELKHQMLRDAFAQHKLELPEVAFVPSEQTRGYRNRLDFALTRVDGKLQLAFHKRGSWEEFSALPEGCALGSERMNEAALDLLEQLNTLEYEVDSAVITVREARTTGQLMTILTTDAKDDWSAIVPKQLGNFLVTRPLPGSGAPGKVVFKTGETFITERIAGIDLSYPYNGFFQANTPVFEQAMTRIIGASKKSKKIIELYSGVGAIGLPLAASGANVVGIETVGQAVTYAERNAKAANITSYGAHTIAAEQMDATMFTQADCIILDPPRAGLHPRVIGWLLDNAPDQIIYLSCNPVTQARDIERLKEAYTLDSLTGFDFYPGALHLESLAVLSKNSAKPSDLA